MYGGALVDDVLRTWHGEPAGVPAAQDVLAADCARAAAACGAATAVEALPA